MSKRYIEVIVSHCRYDIPAQSWRTIIAGEVLRKNFTSPSEALKVALEQRDLAKDLLGSHRSVTIRPNFNEPHLGQIAFREWRSFNGEPFEEIHFTPIKTTSQVRLDNELILPILPTE